MTTNMETAVTTMINMVNGNLEQAVNLAKEKAPELIEQILTWGVFCNALFIVISALVTGPLLFGWYKLVKSGKFDDDEFFHVVLAAVAVFVSVITFFCDIAAIIEICKIKFAPMLYLMDYFSDFVK